MTDQNNTNVTTALTHETTPTFVEMLARCGLSPEVWTALPTAQKEEWVNLWFAEQAVAHG
jgi:hypothetical protein